MELTTQIYQVPDIPQEIIKRLEYDNLAELLNLNTQLGETPLVEEFFADLNEYPVPTALTPEIIEDIQRFSHDILGINLPDLETRYVPTRKILLYLLRLRRLLSEQLEYTYAEEENCHVWFMWRN